MEFTEEQRKWFKAQGAVGGTTAAGNMSPTERIQRAKKAATKRWATKKSYGKMTRAQQDWLAHERDRQRRLRWKKKDKTK